VVITITTTMFITIRYSNYIYNINYISIINIILLYVLKPVLITIVLITFVLLKRIVVIKITTLLFRQTHIYIYSFASTHYR